MTTLFLLLNESAIVDAILKDTLFCTIIITEVSYLLMIVRMLYRKHPSSEKDRV